MEDHLFESKLVDIHSARAAPLSPRSRDWLPLFGERDSEVSKVSLFPTSNQFALVLNVADAQAPILAIE